MKHDNYCWCSVSNHVVESVDPVAIAHNVYYVKLNLCVGIALI